MLSDKGGKYEPAPAMTDSLSAASHSEGTPVLEVP